MSPEMHGDRVRASSFGAVAEAYDRSRPTYPPAMVDDLLADGGRTVLDVGCGTGKAGRIFAERGCEVVGVEPDPRMAAIARRNGLAVEDGTFEAWDPAGRRFDLVVSGQAWHWVDHRVGIPKVADVLAPGGRVALFWNQAIHRPETGAALTAAYRRHAPDIIEDSVALGTLLRSETNDDVVDLVASGRFEEPEVWTYTREERLTTDQWIDLIGTHSDHILLPDERRQALLAAVQDAVPDGLTVTYETTCATARVRRTAPT